MEILPRNVNNTADTVLQPMRLHPLSLDVKQNGGDWVTCKSSCSSLDVIHALGAAKTLAKDERRAGDKDDSCDGENGENKVPDCTFLLQEDPSQQGGKDWIAVGSTTKERMSEKEISADVLL